MQLLSATGSIEQCAVSVWPSGRYTTQTDQRCVDHIDRKSSTENPQLKPHAHCVWAVCSYTPRSTLQLAMFESFNNVQITKQAGSMSCSECLPLVTAITFINIMVFGPGLGLCLSNSHTIFLLIPHFRTLNITIDCYIAFPSDSSSKLFNKCLPIPSLPSPPLSNPPNTIRSQHTIPIT